MKRNIQKELVKTPKSPSRNKKKNVKKWDGKDESTREVIRRDTWDRERWHNYGLLSKLIKGAVGKRFDDFYSEFRKEVNDHDLCDHLKYIFSSDWTSYYIDDNGIIQERKFQKRYKSTQPKRNLIEVDGNTYWNRDGIWYRVKTVTEKEWVKNPSKYKGNRMIPIQLRANEAWWCREFHVVYDCIQISGKELKKVREAQ